MDKINDWIITRYVQDVVRRKKHREFVRWAVRGRLFAITFRRVHTTRVSEPRGVSNQPSAIEYVDYLRLEFPVSDLLFLRVDSCHDSCRLPHGSRDLGRIINSSNRFKIKTQIFELKTRTLFESDFYFGGWGTNFSDGKYFFKTIIEICVCENFELAPRHTRNWTGN